MLQIAIINGPNLNLTGIREPHVYGSTTFEDLMAELTERFKSQATIIYYQSNIEGELINHLHDCRTTAHGVILNAGAYTHTSIALADAISAISIPVIEVHLSNILAREDFRKTSYIASRCIGSISGLGMNGYSLAISHFIETLSSESA